MQSGDPSSSGTFERLDALRATLDQLPRPGAGGTLARWTVLAEIAAEDLSLARLAEGHADAIAILVELDRADLLATCGGGRLGVWAADPGGLRAELTGQGWRLTGTKGWCSGSLGLDHALVTATAVDGPRLFVISTDDPAVVAQPGSWEPMGMAPTRSETLDFHGLDLPSAHAIGPPNAYVDRPGFGHGGAGVAACWWGGAAGVADGLHRVLAEKDSDELATAFGASIADLEAAWSALAVVAQAVDEQSEDAGLALRIAGRVRLIVEGAARRVLERTVEALGASGLCHDPQHATRVADLTVYLSQLRRRPAAADYGRMVADDRAWTPW